MGERKRRMPGGGTILAWLGIIGTIMGILGVSLRDTGLFGGGGDDGLNDQQIVQTLSALQDSKQQAELQLTQIAIAQQQSANDSTAQAINQQQANLQATLDAARAEQDAFLATQNAIIAVTSTAESFATFVAANATATAQFEAQITPSPTSLPTETPIPEVVSDHRNLTGASVGFDRDGRLAFEVETAQPIPNDPQQGLSYVWSLDTDRNPATGNAVQDLGVELRILVRYEDGNWVGNAVPINADGTLADPLFFGDVSTAGPRLTATVDAGLLGIPSVFDWVARTELGGQAYSFFPESGYLSLGG